MKFQAHGIKTENGVEKCRYTVSQLLNGKNAITIYAAEYGHFSDEVRKHFTVENDTDSMTDYFEKDRIRVYPDHPLFFDVADGLRKQAGFHIKRCKTGGFYTYYNNQLSQLAQLAQQVA